MGRMGASSFFWNSLRVVFAACLLMACTVLHFKCWASLQSSSRVIGRFVAHKGLQVVAFCCEHKQLCIWDDLGLCALAADVQLQQQQQPPGNMSGRGADAAFNEDAPINSLPVTGECGLPRNNSSTDVPVVNLVLVSLLQAVCSVNPCPTPCALHLSLLEYLSLCSLLLIQHHCNLAMTDTVCMDSGRQKVFAC